MPAAIAGAVGESTETVTDIEYDLVAVIERGPRGAEDAVTDLGRAIARLEARREGATGVDRRRLERSIDHLRSLSAAERVDAEAKATLVDGRELALEVEREGLGMFEAGRQTVDELERLAAAAESTAQQPEAR